MAYSVDYLLVRTFFRFVPDTEVVQHQLAQQELESSAALSYEEYLRRLTQAVDTEVILMIVESLFILTDLIHPR